MASSSAESIIARSSCSCRSSGGSGNQQQYKRLDFSRLPGYYCICRSSFVGGNVNFCCCRGKKQLEEKTHIPNQKLCSVKTQTKPQQKKVFCKFCYHRRRPASEYKSHFTKSGPEFGAKVVCPLLLQQKCARCGELGHTPKMCKSEHYLRIHANSPENPDYTTFFLQDLNAPRLWQHPIPPALQSIHEKYEEEEVKPSRRWIMMTGDHREYTHDFYMVDIEKPDCDPYSERPETEYELLVKSHYLWMCRNFTNALSSCSRPRPSPSPSPSGGPSGSRRSSSGDITQDEIQEIISKYVRSM